MKVKTVHINTVFIAYEYIKTLHISCLKVYTNSSHNTACDYIKTVHTKEYMSI